MTLKYEIVETEKNQILKRTDKQGEVWWIPMDESNSDYQRYLRWLENPDAKEGSTL